MPTKTNPEEAVRQYLLYLEDPQSLIDQGEVDKASQAVQDAIDPIDKLKAIGQLDRASNVEEAPLRDGFVAYARAWADEAQVPITAFNRLKVPLDVLRLAGFDIGPVSHATTQRAKSVPVEEIKAKMLKLSGQFSFADVMAKCGGSRESVRKALKELVAVGQIENLGPIPDYSGRGRTPTVYKVSEAPTPE